MQGAARRSAMYWAFRWAGRVAILRRGRVQPGLHDGILPEAALSASRSAVSQTRSSRA
jgi:hypothetical protein